MKDEGIPRGRVGKGVEDEGQVRVRGACSLVSGGGQDTSYGFK